VDPLFRSEHQTAGSRRTASKAFAHRPGGRSAGWIYNIFDQEPEDELFPVLPGTQRRVIARVPLDEGSLGGKMTLPNHLS